MNDDNNNDYDDYDDNNDYETLAGVAFKIYKGIIVANLKLSYFMRNMIIVTIIDRSGVSKFIKGLQIVNLIVRHFKRNAFVA